MIVLKDKTKVLKFQKKHNIIDENHNVINANKVNEVKDLYSLPKSPPDQKKFSNFISLLEIMRLH